MKQNFYLLYDYGKLQLQPRKDIYTCMNFVRLTTKFSVIVHISDLVEIHSNVASITSSNRLINQLMSMQSSLASFSSFFSSKYNSWSCWISSDHSYAHVHAYNTQICRLAMIRDWDMNERWKPKWTYQVWNRWSQIKISTTILPGKPNLWTGFMTNIWWEDIRYELIKKAGFEPTVNVLNECCITIQFEVQLVDAIKEVSDDDQGILHQCRQIG